MSQISQDNRLLSIDSSLGKDELLLVSCKGREYISDLFTYDVELLSSNLLIKPEDLVGKAVTVNIHAKVGRVIHGFISRLTLGDVIPELKGLRQYYAQIVPWLWFLKKTSDCKIFQNQSVIDIIKSVFAEAGFSDYKTKLSSTYAKRDYCVQYNESDFDFVSRLLQEEGISYYFTHTTSSHTLILCDANSAYETCKEQTVVYSRGTSPLAHINSWTRTYQFSSGKYSAADFDYIKPTNRLEATTPSVIKLPKITQYEVYEYPGHFTDAGDGKRRTKNKMEMHELGYDTVHATSDCASFTAGYTFGLSQHESSSENGQYLLYEIAIEVSDTGYIAGSGGNSVYKNQFLCVPAAVNVRPQLIYHKHPMAGPQTAIVVGPKGEEIYLDKYNRIKVQFHWDRVGKQDENSSCWVRVSESLSGKKWGTHFIPRIGQEVVVDFIDGDPDKPIVTGSVYNGENNPPYSSKTQSGIKTHSSLKGATSNYNELRFDDKKDSEEVYLQAEKDFNWLVKHDQTGEVQANQTLKVKDNRTITVTDGNESTSILKGTHTLTVSKASKTKAKSILLEADQSIELKVGGSSIKLTPAGIVIKSTKIDIKGSAMVVIKGGLTKIN